MDCVAFLISMGADIQKKDLIGYTGLQYLSSEKLQYLLIAKLAKFDIKWDISSFSKMVTHELDNELDHRLSNEDLVIVANTLLK